MQNAKLKEYKLEKSIKTKNNNKKKNSKIHISPIYYLIN